MVRFGEEGNVPSRRVQAHATLENRAMAKKIYVGNLPLTTTEHQICELFSEFGVVDRVRLVTATDTGRSRGSGFVAMSSGAAQAIEALDRRPMAGRRLRVRPALPLSRSGMSRTPKRARNYQAEIHVPAIAPA